MMIFSQVFRQRLPAVTVACLNSAAFMASLWGGLSCEFIMVAPSAESLSDFGGGTHELGIFCTSPYYRVDSIWITSRVFLALCLANGFVCTCLAWLLAFIIPPNDFNWKCLSILTATTAVLSIPCFLIFDSDPCRSVTQTCHVHLGSFLLVMSFCLYVFVICITQYTYPPKWADELDEWKVNKRGQQNKSTNNKDEEMMKSYYEGSIDNETMTMNDAEMQIFGKENGQDCNANLNKRVMLRIDEDVNSNRKKGTMEKGDFISPGFGGLFQGVGHDNDAIMQKKEKEKCDDLAQRSQRVPKEVETRGSKGVPRDAGRIGQALRKKGRDVNKDIESEVDNPEETDLNAPGQRSPRPKWFSPMSFKKNKKQKTSISKLVINRETHQNERRQDRQTGTRVIQIDEDTGKCNTPALTPVTLLSSSCPSSHPHSDVQTKPIYNKRGHIEEKLQSIFVNTCPESNMPSSMQQGPTRTDDSDTSSITEITNQPPITSKSSVQDNYSPMDVRNSRICRVQHVFFNRPPTDTPGGKIPDLEDHSSRRDIRDNRVRRLTQQWEVDQNGGHPNNPSLPPVPRDSHTSKPIRPAYSFQCDEEIAGASIKRSFTN